MNLYGFIRNDPNKNHDSLGLLTASEVDDAFSLFASQNNGKPCCCTQKLHWSLTTKGSASGSTVNVTAHSPTPGNPDCLLSITYFWWNCVQAQNDYIAAVGAKGYWNIIRGNLDWHNYGFYLGPNPDVETHSGSQDPFSSLVDGGKWAFYVTVFYVECKNGKTLAHKDQSSPETQFTWTIPIIGYSPVAPGSYFPMPIYGPGYWVPD